MEILLICIGTVVALALVVARFRWKRREERRQEHWRECYCCGKVGVVVQCIIQTFICVTATAGEPEADRLMTILDLIQSDERKLWEMGNCVPHQPPMGAWGGMVRDYLGR